MAKGKGKTKPKSKGKAGAKPARPPKDRKPRQGVLPGTEQVRDRVLDAAFEAIGDAREDAATARTTENEQKEVVMARMEARAKSGLPTVYRHSGVEISYMIGHAKLRIRKIKGGAEEPIGDMGPGTTEADGAAAEA